MSTTDPPTPSHKTRREVVTVSQGSIVVDPDRPAVTAHTGHLDAGHGPARDLFATGMTLALTRLGIAFLHGTAFQIGNAAPVAVGASGAGKSTLAAAALGCGAQVVSDDSLLAGFDDGSVTVSAFRNYLSFRDNPVGLLPASLRDRMTLVDDGGRRAWRLGLECLERSDYTPFMVPDRLWVLSIDRRLRRSKMTELDQGEGLAALIPATSPLMLSPRYRRERAATMPILSRLVEDYPSYRVRLGRDLLDDPETTLAFLLDA